MLDLPFFWLGPLGGLVPMACPDDGVSSELEMAGTLQQALNGRQVMDVTSYRRTWGITESWLEPDDYALLEAFLTSTHDQTLRLVDPLIVNRARLFASVTSDFAGFAQVRNAWRVSAGASPTFPMLAWPDVSFTSQGDARSVSYGHTRVCLWEPTTSATLNVNGDPTDLSRCDAVRTGEQLTISAWVRTAGGGTVAIGITGVNAVGAATTSAASSEAAHASWTRISATYVVPSGTVGVCPQFASTSATGEIYIAGIMLNSGSTALPFVRGGGGSEVILTSVNADSPRFPLTSASLTLTEV